MRNYETAFCDLCADNNSFEQWSEEGSPICRARANAQVEEDAAEYEAPPLDPGRDEELRDFVARRKAGMADAWY